MAARAVRALKLKCPQCGADSRVEIREDVLATAASSPTGLVGVADYHGDHVLVVYVDSEGRDRGVRVFRALLRGETIRVNTAFLSHMNSIAGFRVSSGGWSVECFAGNPRALLRVFRDELMLDLELKDFGLASKAMEWSGQFLAALQRVGQPDPGGLLLSVLLLDAYMPEQPSLFSRRTFEIVMKSGRLIVRTDRSAAELFRESASRVPWLSPRFVDFAVSVNGLRLVDAVLGSDPLTIQRRLVMLMSLERRGVVHFEEVGA